jgi:uncharacterized repeat protein (TIGR03803 family)
MGFSPCRTTCHRIYLALGVFVITLGVASRALGQAQEKVLYSFCSAANCTDGLAPHGKLVFDKAGNLYGTTAGGGSNCQNGVGGCGIVFELSLSDGSWAESVLYSFGANSSDGAFPEAGPTFDNAGNLYGTTQGGGAYGLGTVFELSPSPRKDGSWTETVLWSFGAPGDGKVPLSHLVFDTSGKLYGTAAGGGTYGGGIVFQLVPTSGGQWSENIIFSFGPDPYNGYEPEAAVTFDKSGNLYGTTYEGGFDGGSGVGVAYKLSPNSQLPWTETVLVRFTRAKGGNPLSALSFDKLGNLYGTLSSWGFNGAGGVFKLSPGHENTITFPGAPYPASPLAGALIDGNTLYGTTTVGGSQNSGTIFKVQGKTDTVVYSFCSQTGCTDGKFPAAALIGLGKSLFGTTTNGGANGIGGVVFQISETAPSRAKTSSAKGTHAAKVRQAASSSR